MRKRVTAKPEINNDRLNGKILPIQRTEHAPMALGINAHTYRGTHMTKSNLLD